MASNLQQAAPRDMQFSPDRVAFNQEACPICITSFQNHEIVTELACRHIFHKNCIEDPRNGNSCPTCRTPIAGRVHHQLNIEGGLSFLLNLSPLFSDDPVVLNLQLEERAQRALAERPLTFREAIGMQQGVIGRLLEESFQDMVRRVFLGNQQTLDIRQRADALFLEQEMNMLRPLNRIRRLIRITSLPQYSRFIDVCEDPRIRTEFSQRIIREHRADSFKALVISLTIFVGTLIYVKFFRTPN